MNVGLRRDGKGAGEWLCLALDGSLLAVVWWQGRDCDLWLMSPTGGNRVQIKSHPSYDDGPSWSPDGKEIVFVSTRSGNFGIWTVEVDAEQVWRELSAQGQLPDRLSRHVAIAGCRGRPPARPAAEPER